MKVKGNGGTSVRKTQKYFYTKNDMKKKKNTAQKIKVSHTFMILKVIFPQ